MAEIECTAGDRDALRQLLFEPDCTCPRCAPDSAVVQVDDRRWLRMSGTTQRLRIENVALGDGGHALLG